MYNWVILSSGDKDLLQVAVSTALFIGVDPNNIKRFDGTPDPYETLLMYLTEKKERQNDTVDFVVHERMKPKRFNRFAVPDRFFLQTYWSWVERMKLDFLILPSHDIPKIGAERIYGPVHCGQIGDIDWTTCAIVTSPMGAEKLHDVLLNDTSPDFMFVPEPMFDFYTWEYAEGCYD